MRLTWILLPVVAVGVIASGLLLTSSLTRAVQAPTLAIDMVPADNTYTDTTNAMAVVFNPATDFCLASSTANPATHLHTAHVLVQNVEDLVGFQVRLNYTGDRFRPNTVNFIPFPDSGTGQNISFVNLPIDGLVHRDLVSATSIPPQAAGPQTAAFGSTYVGAQNFPISPDTPAKVPVEVPAPNYTAPSGGVLASFTLQVFGDQSGQLLSMDMDDGIPNGPGSGVAIFNGTASQDVLLPETSLGDASHAEGAACQASTPTATPTATPAPTATATATRTPGPVGATPTRTATPGAGVRTPTRTPVASPIALPPSLGNPGGDGGWSPLAYILVFTAVAVPVSGLTYQAVRLRRR